MVVSRQCYGTIKDEKVIVSCSSKDNENSEETDIDNDEQPAVMNHTETVSQLDELMVYFEWQVEKTPAKLLMVKSMHGRAVCKQYSKLTQQKLTSYFKK